MITELDIQVGRIVAALKQKKMLDKTLGGRGAESLACGAGRLVDRAPAARPLYAEEGRDDTR